MLVHHFGSRANLDREVIRAVEEELHNEAARLADALGGLQALDALIKGFRSPASAQVRRLFRTLTARAFGNDELALSILLGERERWHALFSKVLGSRSEANDAVSRLLGAAMDAILDDMSVEEPKRKRRRLK